MIEKDGWVLMRVSGSHHIFEHGTKSGTVVIPLHNGTMPIGTTSSILKQAGLKCGAKNMKKYIALFETDEDAENVGVVIPDLPGCFSAGKNFNEAFRNAHEAVAGYLDGAGEHPKARTLEEIKKEWDDWAEWENNYKFVIGFVSAIPSSKPKKYTVYLDSALMAQIDNVSTNRSAFLAEAAKRMLGALSS
jgi:predicted RNA binding protein YcfA (HicA-like mRNA interferase family)/predicted RNase H-like HicB family nuclease